MYRALPQRFLRRFAREDGFALPTVILMVFVGFSMAGVAALGSIGAQRGTSRDYDTKDALAAAETGLHEAMYRYNATTAAGGTWMKCLPSGATPDASPGRWCPPVQATLPDGSEFTYRVGFPQPLPSLPPTSMKVISQGESDGVSRRLAISGRSANDLRPFSQYGVIGLNSVTVDQYGKIGTVAGRSNTASNGNISLGANAELCGDTKTPPGFGVIGGGTHTCGDELEGITTLPPVNQGNVVTNNQNGNFFAVNPVVSGNKNNVCWNGKNANGATSNNCGPRELVLGSNTAVTLNGGNYSLCRLHLNSNSALYVTNSAEVTIYFDSPDGCGYPRPGGSASCPTASAPICQLLLESNSSISANGGTANNVRLLFVGSETIPTTIKMSSNTQAELACNQDFVVYAPRTDIDMIQNSYFCGAIAGKTIHVQSNTAIRTSNVAQEYQLPNWVEHFVIDDFKECVGAAPAPAAGPPDTGC